MTTHLGARMKSQGQISPKNQWGRLQSADIAAALQPEDRIVCLRNVKVTIALQRSSVNVILDDVLAWLIVREA
jgi:hypothetical protein